MTICWRSTRCRNGLPTGGLRDDRAPATRTNAVAPAAAVAHCLGLGAFLAGAVADALRRRVLRGSRAVRSLQPAARHRPCRIPPRPVSYTHLRAHETRHEHV